MTRALTASILALACGPSTFECAMTEDAALRMAADERVTRVSETTYVLADDPPSTSLREPRPGPTPWRP